MQAPTCILVDAHCFACKYVAEPKAAPSFTPVQASRQIRRTPRTAALAAASRRRRRFYCCLRRCVMLADGRRHARCGWRSFGLTAWPSGPETTLWSSRRPLQEAGRWPRGCMAPSHGACCSRADPRRYRRHEQSRNGQRVKGTARGRVGGLPGFVKSVASRGLVDFTHPLRQFHRCAFIILLHLAPPSHPRRSSHAIP
jgi:hypothetical protein